jgi:hypothetical protein
MTPEERQAWIERVRRGFAEKRARGEVEGDSSEQRLEELELDQRAGRTVRFDIRVSPEEKLT